LYGSSAMGGVVNLISADPPPGLHGRARATFATFANPPHDIWTFRDFTGSQSGFDGMVSHGGEEWRWEARGGGWHSDGYRQHNRADHWHAGARTVWIASPTTRLDLNASWASNQYQTALLWCTQGRCDDGGQEYQPFKVDTGGIGDHTRSDKGFLSVAFRSTPRADFAWRARGSYFHTHFIDFHRTRDDESFADRLGAEIQSELHPRPDRVVTMGGEVGLSYIHSNIFSGDTGSAYRGRSQTEFAAYAESEQRWGAARITLGARLDAIGVDGGSFTAVPSPRIGAVLPSGVGVLRASLGRGFRAPSPAELYVSTFVQGLRVIPNPNLKPEIGWSAEVGDALPFGDGGGWTGYLDAAAFWNEARDLIEPQIVSGGTQIQFQNVTAARMVGLD
ncbi:MAG: TonB-dependent receptor plug domain-containing protein, partial [Gemmatimonadales bacterium]